MDGARLAVRRLKELGAGCAFGLPGTQNLSLLEALAREQLPLIVPTHELAASFAAGAWYRATGRPGLLLTIPGPGFTYALTGLAEARLDSLALVHCTVAPAAAPGRRFQLQALDQGAVAAPLAKSVITVTETASIGPALDEAWHASLAGEPGPVVVQIAAGALSGAAEPAPPTPPPPAPLDPTAVEETRRRLLAADRVVLLTGQGCLGAAESVGRLVAHLGAVLCTTTSGRGVIDETDPRSLGYELAGTREEVFNELVAASDLVLVLGAKLSHNAARGFRLDLPAQKLIHVDAAPEVLEANYPASLAVVAEVGAFLEAVGRELPSRPGFGEDELRAWKRRAAAASWLDVPEPRLAGAPAAEFFSELGRRVGPEATLVADSGLHQLLARRWWKVRRPGGLLLPTDLQSMGFALPAAVAVAAARPGRRTLALLGDGGFLMSGLELLTAVKHGLELTVLVVDDGGYGLIRRSQEAAWGRGVGSSLVNPDFEALAGALGANFVRLGDAPGPGLEEALGLPGVTLVQVPAQESPGLKVARAKGRVKRWLGR